MGLLKKDKDNGYISAKESHRIAKENRKITGEIEKKRNRKHIPEEEYITKMKNPDNCVEFDNVHTYFFTDIGTVKAVDGVSFDVPQGKTVGIVGESGCGKSVTSLSLMQLVQRPTGQTVEGEIRFDDGNRTYNIVNTPISVMQMILQSEDTPEHRELSAELFRIEQYVEMVLTYIRLGSDDHDFVFRECDLDALVRQSIRKYAQQFIRRKIRLVYKPTELTVLTDEKWLTFILEQLLSNAVKYTPQGSVTITVTPDKKLYVSDTGIGISPEDLPRIFEKGFTGYNGRADKKSTGLGLYLCRQTADKLGIGIMADSTPGKGSVFTLDLSTRRLEVE